MIPEGIQAEIDTAEALDEAVLVVGAPPLVQKSTGMVIAGHTRLKAAVQIGLERLPVRVLDVDDSRARALALADNRISELPVRAFLLHNDRWSLRYGWPVLNKNTTKGSCRMRKLFEAFTSSLDLTGEGARRYAERTFPRQPPGTAIGDAKRVIGDLQTVASRERGRHDRKAGDTNMSHANRQRESRRNHQNAEGGCGP